MAGDMDQYLLEQQGVVENVIRKLLNGAHNLRESKSLCVRRRDNDHVVTLRQQQSTIRMDASNNHLSAGTWPNGQNISNPTFISTTTDTVTSNQNLNPITTNSHSSNQKESSPDKLQQSMIRKGASPAPIKNNPYSFVPAINSSIPNCADNKHTTPSNSKLEWREDVLDFAEKLLLRDAGIAYGGVDEINIFKHALKQELENEAKNHLDESKRITRQMICSSFFRTGLLLDVGLSVPMKRRCICRLNLASCCIQWLSTSERPVVVDDELLLQSTNGNNINTYSDASNEHCHRTDHVVDANAFPNRSSGNISTLGFHYLSRYYIHPFDANRTMVTLSKLDSTSEDKGKMIIAEPEIIAISDLRPIHCNKTIEAVVYHK
ncbi:hypothetical protein Tco_0833239 [Tanacetum coccineum]